MARDFQTFLKQLEASGELKRVDAEVDPYLEAGAIADRVSKQPGGGSALLFDRIKGAAMPVAMNVFGSARRMAMALGVDQDPAGLDAVAARIEKLIQEAMPKPGSSFLDKLAKLPVLTTWPEDGGPFITLGLGQTRFRSGHRNMGLYRLQVYDEHTLGFHTQLHHDGTRARHGYAPGERMPVAVSFGGDPALTYAATAPLPPFLSEIMFTGFLRGEGVELVRCVSNDLEVPADSEIVIEGWVDPGELRREGPFGDHTGYYSLADDYPVLHVEAITHRKKAVYPATIVGRPPQEDAYLGLATERIFLPLLRMVLPEVVDMHLPPAGGFHNLVIVAIRKEYPGHAQKVMNAIWGTGQMMFSKGIVVVDQDIDPHDGAEVLFRVTSNVDPRRDLLFTDGPLDVLDHSSDRFAFGSKVGIDATRKSVKLDDFRREWPRDLVFPEATLALLQRRWQEYGV